MGSESRPLRRSRTRVVLLVLLGVAVVATIALTLSPRPIHAVLDPSTDRILSRLHGWGLPLAFDGHDVERAENVALFVPLGLLVALLLPRRWWWAVALGGLVVSLGIESAQATALPDRVASFRDVLANTCGAVIGVGVSVLHRARRAQRSAAEEHLGAEHPVDVEHARAADLGELRVEEVGAVTR